MDNLKEILLKKQIKPVVSTRPINMRWEQAREFGEYVGLPTVFVLKLFRLYGDNRVLNLRSWLKDCPRDPKRYAGLVIWKLKQGKSEIKLPVDNR